MMSKVRENSDTVEEMAEQFPRMQRKTNEIHREYRHLDDSIKTQRTQIKEINKLI